MNTLRQRSPKRRGMALVWVALTGIVFIVFLALAADSARVYVARHQLQNGADAAALAGVYKVRNDPADVYKAIKFTTDKNTVGGDPSVGGGNIQLAPNPANAGNGDIVI